MANPPPCSVHEKPEPYSGEWADSRVPGAPVNESNGYAARTQTRRPGFNMPASGEPSFGGLYLWSSFRSSNSSLAAST